MFGWGQALYGYLSNMVYPRPPAGAGYGFRWQAGQGVPAALNIYDVAGGAVPAGLYVVFTGSLLDNMTDPFGRVGIGAPGPVFAAPGAPSAALTNLVNSVARNPPPEEPGWANPAPGRLADIDGFLRYGANCLNLINQTAAGAQLLNGLSAGAFPVFISPGLMSNQTFAGGIDGAVDTLTKGAKEYAQGGPIPGALIDAAVKARYVGIGGLLGKYNQLAADMKAAPLYSLFVPGANFQQNYLNARFRFRQAPLTGQILMNWVSPGGFAVFDATLRSMSAPQQDGVIMRDFFLLAMCVALYPSAQPGPGAGAGVKFYVQRHGDNLLGSPSFRPPAIGLAHELMHARHYTRGSSPGYEINHYSTTAAELMFAGIGPSATDPVSENTIRAQWAGIAGPVDPSNLWAPPVQRLVYEPPGPGQTARTMRLAMHCI
jgi:hypothetical protein